MRQPTIKTFVIPTVLILTGCGLGKGSDENIKNPDTPKLVGSWESNCAEAAVLDLAQTKKELSFPSISEFAKTERFYADNTCNAPGLTERTVGTYTLEGKLEEDRSLEKINFHVNSSYLKPETDVVSTALNAANYCGVNDWKQGIEVEVTGKTCDGIASNKGDVIFDVYRLDDNKLQLSKKFLFLTPNSGDDRPTEVSDELIYTKK